MFVRSTRRRIRPGHLLHPRRDAGGRRRREGEDAAPRADQCRPQQHGTSDRIGVDSGRTELRRRGQTAEPRDRVRRIIHVHEPRVADAIFRWGSRRPEVDCRVVATTGEDQRSTSVFEPGPARRVPRAACRRATLTARRSPVRTRYAAHATPCNIVRALPLGDHTGRARMAGYPSGQRDLTVNQTCNATGVRIPHPPRACLSRRRSCGVTAEPSTVEAAGWLRGASRRLLAFVSRRRRVLASLGV